MKRTTKTLAVCAAALALGLVAWPYALLRAHVERQRRRTPPRRERLSEKLAREMASDDGYDWRRAA